MSQSKMIYNIHMCIFPSVRVFKYYVRVSSVEDGEARKVLTAESAGPWADPQLV